MRSDCIEKALKRFFTLYGRFLGRHPVIFIIIPLAIAAGLGTGSRYIYTETDAEFLYTPSNGPAKDEKRTVDALFVNRTCRGAPVSRRTCLVESARIIAVAKTPGGILQREPFEQLLKIDERIRGISISDGDETITFDDLCAKKQNEPCDTISLFELYGYDADNLDKMPIGYPFTAGRNNKTYFIGNEISGVTFSPLGIVEDATAIQLSYSLKGGMDGLSIDWMDGFLEECDELESELLEFYVYTTHSLAKELSKSSRDVIGQFSIAFSMLIGFSILSCFRFDCVQNKPTLAAAGVMSACLAILSAFGLIGLCGVPYIDISSSAPYFIISIGVDDMFIMMSAWKKTSPRKPVDERTSETLSDAALSITITSLTDTLVFVVGAFSPFPSVSYFSILTGAAVIFDYLYQITFFAACMVISGRREAAYRHSILCCIKVKPQENSKNCCCYVASAGSPSDDNATNGNVSSPAPNSGQSDYAPVPVASYNVESNTVEHNTDVIANTEPTVVDTPHPLMIFFRDKFSPFICKPRVKAVILTIYLAYIGCAIWGVTCLQEGLAYQEMLPAHSFVTQFLDVESLYFKKFGFPVSVVIYEKFDPSNPTYQEDFDNELKRFENQKFTLSCDYSMSWLRSYDKFLNSTPPAPGADLGAMDVLDTFLQQPDFSDFWYDLDVDDNDHGYVIASRFYVSTTNIKHTSDEKEMMDTFRELAETSDHNITVFTPPFIFYDQYLKVLPTTIRSLGIALLAMMLVSLMLIPVKLCAVWVTVTILSIELGMIGFMAFWGVHLDPVSMIVIIVCIGFSVDFPAHITYLYATSEAETADEKIQEALFSIGMPVLQGAGSSIIGVLVISSSDVYIFQAFFKTMFLVISLGAIHALFILPVLLSLFSRSTPRASADDKSSRNLQNKGYEPNADDDVAATQHKVV